jgi:hypothetical protein
MRSSIGADSSSRSMMVFGIFGIYSSKISSIRAETRSLNSGIFIVTSKLEIPLMVLYERFPIFLVKILIAISPSVNPRVHRTSNPLFFSESLTISVLGMRDLIELSNESLVYCE